MRIKATIMDAEQIDRALSRMAHEIVERNGGSRDLVLVGIRTRGVPLSERITDKIEAFEGTRVPTGSVDITLYRDDLSQIAPNPVVQATELSFGLEDSTVVLVDDVLFTGRTVKAAFDVLTDYGRPRAIQLAVLIDRGHRELPIRADFVGKNVPTSLREIIEVRCEPVDGEDRILLLEVDEPVLASAKNSGEPGAQ
ncbi:MAG: bifunctional pyr operon transcriptional regulator/uracil phosphoribosyltransferase PyrR, partial [Acidobacteriota bacterium]